MMRLSNRYTNSKDRCVLMVRDLATRALVLQAIEEQARTLEQAQLQNIYILSFLSENTRWWCSVYNQMSGLSNTRADMR
jgi:hypothetical protein